MHLFTAIFLVAVTAATLLQLYLGLRQIRHVRARRDAVPPAFADSIPLAAHQKAADYTVARSRLGLASTAWGALVLLGFTLGGGLDALDHLWGAAGLGPIATGTGFLFSVALVGTLLDLPFALYSTFGIERRFGFNRIGAGLYAADLAKQFLLGLLFGLPLAALVLWLMDAGQDPISPAYGNAGWWLWVWAAWMGFSLLMLWAFPTFIAPLFNRFTPLEDQALVERIERLLARCGFASKGIFVMDGSRRSTHGNAYFSGLGSSKRIVFFDTLLKTLTADEIEAVLAHELGHFRRRHVTKRFLTVAASSLAGLALLGWLLREPWFYAGLGLSAPSVHGALALFLLVSPVFTVFAQPLLTSLLRRHEFEADDFAAQQADPRQLIAALVKLYRDNASTLTPDPWHSAFHDSHPPAPVRVAHLAARAGV